MSDEGEYRQIFKATGIFGGVQAINVLIAMVKMKCIAIFLGADGIGIMGLFNSTIELIRNSTGLGINQSAVKEIAQGASESEDKLAVTIKIVNRWVWATGMIGAFLMIIFSGFLSEFTFGNKDYSLAFVCLSSVVFFTSITGGQNAILQGTRSLNYLAWTGIGSAFFGLIVSVPLYYFWGIPAIAPSLILVALITSLITYYYVRRIKVKPVSVSNKDILKGGESMVKLGISMTINGYASVLIAYFIRIYINSHGGVQEVGFYQSAFILLETYFGMIFTAMATDYYPGLVAVSQHDDKVNEQLNKQSEIGLLIITPLLSLFLLALPLIIKLLYTHEFLAVIPLLTFAVFGIIFKVISFSMSYVLFAKGKNKLFVIASLISYAGFLLNNMLWYKYEGLKGLGISYSINYLLSFFVNYFLCKKVTSYKMSKSLQYILFTVFGLTFVGFIICISDVIPFKIAYSCLIVVVTSVYAFYMLNKKMDLKSLFNRFKK